MANPGLKPRVFPLDSPGKSRQYRASESDAGGIIIYKMPGATRDDAVERCAAMIRQRLEAMNEPIVSSGRGN
jgi:hypothetical protein